MAQVLNSGLFVLVVQHLQRHKEGGGKHPHWPFSSTQQGMVISVAYC